MHTALSVQELGMVIERHDRPMPNAWMNIKPAAAVTPERNELLRCHVVPRQSERHDKTLAMQRIEQLAAIGMVIGAPDQRLLPLFRGAVGGRLFRPIAPGEEVAVAYSVVPSLKGLAFPPELEHSFGDASLIPGILVNRSPALCRPADDLDRDALWRVNEASVPLEGTIARCDERRLMDPPHACGRHVGDRRQIKIHNGPRSVDRPNHSMQRRLTLPPVLLSEAGAEQC